MSDNKENEVTEAAAATSETAAGTTQAEPVSYTHLTLPTTPYV